MYQPPAQPENLYPAEGGPVPGQPVTPVVQPVVNQPIYQPPIVNQQQPVAVYQQPLIKLKTSSVNIICPHCHNQVQTIVETKCNCLNCCFCWCFCLLWLIVELVSDKDLNCQDAVHKCPSCGCVIGNFTAC